VTISKREPQVIHDGRETTTAYTGSNLGAISLTQRRPVNLDSLKCRKSLVGVTPELIEYRQLGLRWQTFAPICVNGCSAP